MQTTESTGFTLLELLIVIAIVGILAALAGPSLRTLLLNNQLASETNELLVDLAFARAESARVGKRITLCISTSGTSCGTGSSWTSGRISFVDESTSGTTGTVDSGEEIRRTTKPSSNNSATITASGFTNSAGSSTNNFIQYRPNGSLNSTTTGRFKICDNRVGNFGRSIEILPTGRASLKSTSESCP
ncbi:MAG: prepilin-type N-terminal cleavage/methylation domain-containing protein [Rhodocyclales bacterium GT-UBC]|nr:MAG: prepilin-type N-terminal cleavage/methylation domain-containing protein [Rhodocyclales bacterium GT-UBC]